jgi:two-component system response regulator DegU
VHLSSNKKVKRVRIIIVDDQYIVRELLRAILNDEPEFELIAEFDSGEPLLERVAELNPDIILMDIQMPGIDGLTATRKLKQLVPDSEVIMLTSSEDPAVLRESLASGASGYIIKNPDQTNLVNSIKTIAGGGSLINPHLLRKLIQDFATIYSTGNQGQADGNGVEPGPAPEIDGKSTLENLTRRERQVLGLIGQGLSNSAISQHLGISHDTVKSHVRSILLKLDVKDRTQAAVLAIRNNLG